ncbi:MAG: hypothetical protein AMJ45_05245 [Syntrophobacter sp. DG_60]|nr:MAG: hypothetical protein AMJ45_05245 [Syntrophobacter sp. DG_60]
MELNIKKSILFDVLQKIQAVIERRTTMPILSHILLQAESSLEVTATDLELLIKGNCPAQIIQKGEVAIPGAKLYEIIRLLDCDQVYLRENENHWLDIKGGRAFFSLATLPAEDFPDFPETEHLKTISIDQDILKKLVIKTQFSMAREMEEASRELSGIFFEKIKSDIPKIRLVSSDGYRLTYMEAPFSELDVFQFETGIIIPRKAITEMLRLTEGGSLEIGFDDRVGIVRAKTNTLFIRVLDKKFPHYKSYIPKDDEYEARASRDELREILKRMLVIITSKNKAARFLFNPSKLKVEVDNSEIGTAHEDLDIEYKAEPFQIMLNTSFLLDALNVMESPIVHLGLNKDKACVLTGEEDLGFKALIMPIVG